MRLRPFCLSPGIFNRALPATEFFNRRLLYSDTVAFLKTAMLEAVDRFWLTERIHLVECVIACPKVLVAISIPVPRAGQCL
jgi:hypothetical protein